MKKIAMICAMFLVVPLVALAQLLPDTGQTNCYDAEGNAINPCPNLGEPFYGQDAQYPCNPQSYTKLDEGGNPLPDDAPWPWAMVQDNVTGLIWEVKTNDNKNDIFIWTEAVSYCESLSLGGYEDWRVPTVKELSFIRNMDPLHSIINTHYFPTLKAGGGYWSSTPVAAFPSEGAWIVIFHNQRADVLTSYKPARWFVQAVRGGQTSNNFIDNGDETITDIYTDLMWQKDTAPETYTWEEALMYCDTLTHAGYNDWRLPDFYELQSLVDYDSYNPAIDSLFSNTQSDVYWSSTTHRYSPYLNQAFYMDFNYGDNRTGKWKPADFYVRAVRGGQCDADGDGFPYEQDNCPETPNPDQLDTYPPQGNDIGDACDCESDFDCDGNVDAIEVDLFLVDFGRSTFNNPCTNADPCNGDVNCDVNVDAFDVTKFLEDFGRSQFNNPCQPCVVGDWCVYP